jgi:hypothetical protein
MKLEKIQYSALNARQRENFNYQKVAAELAEYGFVTHRLSDDWHGADFIAQHVDGETFLKVQLKSRLTLAKKYLGKNLYICFPYGKQWFLHPHDALADHLLGITGIGATSSWTATGLYTMGTISKSTLEHLQRYAL